MGILSIMSFVRGTIVVSCLTQAGPTLKHAKLLKKSEMHRWPKMTWTLNCQNALYILRLTPRGPYYHPLLALLVCVSRAHEIEIRPSTVCRQSVASIISEFEPIAWISFKFCFLVSLAHVSRRFLNFWKKWFLDILRIFFVVVNMGPYGSKKFQNTTPPSNYVWLFSNFF